MNKLIRLVAALQASGTLIRDVFRGVEPEEEPLTKQVGALVLAHRDDAGNLCLHIDNETIPRDMKFLADALIQQAEFKEYIEDGMNRLSDSIRDD